MVVEKVVIGRDRDDLLKFRDRGTAFIGKHVVGKSDEAHLTNPVVMDVTKPHILLVCGKRGTGKSFSGGVVAEEIAMLPDDIRKNLSVLMIDTMGIYWSMKNPNERGRELLSSWGMEPKGFPIRLLAPKGYVKKFSEMGIEVDAPLTLPTGEISAMDWITTFGFSLIDDHGIAIERAIKETQSLYGKSYTIDDIIDVIDRDEKIPLTVKESLVNRFMSAIGWGVFEREGTSLGDILKPGQITVLDISQYASFSQGWSIRGMLVGLLSRQIYQARVIARKAEETEEMTGHAQEKIPMVWMIIDECHQFLPAQGETAATEPLLTLVRQGRQPGISLLFITQRPNKLHPDALAQSDLVISHRLTSRADIEALRGVMQTYMLEDIQDYINELPKTKGSAIVLDDNSERIFPIQVRPRFSWHAGGSASAIKEKSIFEETETEKG